MYNIMQDNIHPIYRVCLINSKSCSFSTSCKHITFFFIFMNIVTQYLEANCITLSESDTQKLYDIVKLQLIIPGEDVTTNTVLKKFFTDCNPSDNTKNIEKPVKCFVFYYSLLSRPYMQKYQIRKTVKCK